MAENQHPADPQAGSKGASPGPRPRAASESPQDQAPEEAEVIIPGFAPPPPLPTFAPTPVIDLPGSTRTRIPAGLEPLWEVSSMGFEVVVYVAVGGGIGWLLDRFAGTAPVGVPAGCILGILAGGYRLVRGGLGIAKRMDKGLGASGAKQKGPAPKA